MTRLTKQQKYKRRMIEYIEAIERTELRIYGESVDATGNYHVSYSGYPQGFPWTKAYGERRKRRRRLCSAVARSAGRHYQTTMT